MFLNCQVVFKDQTFIVAVGKLPSIGIPNRWAHGDHLIINTAQGCCIMCKGWIWVCVGSKPIITEIDYIKHCRISVNLPDAGFCMFKGKTNHTAFFRKSECTTCWIIELIRQVTNSFERAVHDFADLSSSSESSKNIKFSVYGCWTRMGYFCERLHFEINWCKISVGIHQ